MKQPYYYLIISTCFPTNASSGFSETVETRRD